MLTFGGPQEPVTPTRARRPPGGASSLSLAWDPNPTQPAVEQPRKGRAAVPGASTPRSGVSSAWDEAPRSNNQPSMPVAGDIHLAKSRGGGGARPWVAPLELDDEDGTEGSSYWVQGMQIGAPYSDATAPEDQGAYNVYDPISDVAHREQGPKDVAFGQRLRRSSSDVFASGSRQNCGNVMTDVPSTRVRAPPGGKSSFSLAWETDSDVHSSNAQPKPSKFNNARECDSQSNSHYSDAGPRTPKSRGGADEFVPKSYRQGNFDTQSSNAGSRTPPAAFRDQRQRQQDFCESEASYSNAGPRTPKGGPPATHRQEVRGSDEASVLSQALTPRNLATRQPLQRSSSNPCIQRPSSDCVSQRDQNPAFGQRLQRGSDQSSNAFARGCDQNSGNMLTNRPTTRVCAPPGGASSIVFGGDDASSQAEANRTPRNATPRNTTPRNATPRNSTPRSATPSNVTPRNTMPHHQHSVQQDSGSVADSCSVVETQRQQPRDWRQNVASDEYESSQTESRITPRSQPSQVDQFHARRGQAAPDKWANNASESASRTTEGSSTPRKVDGCAGKPSFDPNALKNLKGRMIRRQSSASSTTASGTGSQVYNEDFGFGNFSIPKRQMSQRSSSTPSLLSKDAVEGSQPRKWKPAKAPQAAPGGASTFHPAKDGKADVLAGRKRFDDMGCGNNRDPNAIEALRFYQDKERLGKNAGTKHQHSATRQARDSHRYYLAAEDRPEPTPGKARNDASKKRMQRLPGFAEPLQSQWTSGGGSECDLPSECDSLPLGAEWSSCRFGDD